MFFAPELHCITKLGDESHYSESQLADGPNSPQPTSIALTCFMPELHSVSVFTTVELRPLALMFSLANSGVYS